MDESFFARDVLAVAADLLGTRLLVNGVGGLIVETEAYRQDDEASHSFRGRTAGNAAMFGVSGLAYVYRSYGLHWCFNIVCERGSAVLIRALEPTHGLETMVARRSVAEARKLCAGPGNLCKALAITGDMNRLSVFTDPFSLVPPSEMPVWASGVRIGISKAAERPWRFAVRGSRYLSRPI
ncbi:DNA-3-methyladenine glycosylase [Shinella sp.]|uniref:DNA-3-methyladenine glycosylase n=1 Tax=Shinella sp. TaxID=1870904 RepID=UPI0028AEF498|nr:DNA-3-methyladenine glycosylase [Shinella sp.]